MALLSARSPKLTVALRKAKRDGLTHLILDGTLIRTDRVAADRPYFSVKHQCHGINVQVIAAPDGRILWTSGTVPGKIYDLTAVRVWGILRELRVSPDKTSYLVKAIAVLQNQGVFSEGLRPTFGGDGQ